MLLTTNYNWFIKQDMSEYSGKWIAICKKAVVGNGKNAKEALEKAQKKCPGEEPILTKIPSKKEKVLIL